MWRRTYLLLLLVRFYFAISPSYIHPDENFQGPEVIAGTLFSFPHHLTWEFTSEHPVRSVFPLWPVYGFPMVVLRWVWTETGKEEVAPKVIYYTLRVLMFILSFVLEDWAIHELIPSLRHRRLAGVLVASSYVTWTYQIHTFSNSIETLVVAWSLVMIQRIMENKQRSSLLSSALLGAIIMFGIFNRITFPAFVFFPCLYLVPHFLRKPLSLVVFALATLLTTLLAEPRFLLPAIPLLLTSMHLPKSRLRTRYFLATWMVFNTVLALLMGIFHQGGVVPAQIWLGEQRNMSVGEVFWWRTYSPPVWLLDGNRLRVTDLMGIDIQSMISRLEIGIGTGCGGSGVGLVAPRSSTGLDAWTDGAGDGALVFEELWTYRRHVGLDDLDWGGEGVWQTLSRVVGRRGLTVWKVGRRCDGADEDARIGTNISRPRTAAEQRVDGDGGVRDEG
ncbi:alpha 1,2 mannosyltransferase [Pseudocyphellaria aurata]|nr:alpha 1,2 mannosyltransferase [Pseudocyphellaria aurata]